MIFSVKICYVTVSLLQIGKSIEVRVRSTGSAPALLFGICGIDNLGRLAMRRVAEVMSRAANRYRSSSNGPSAEAARLALHPQNPVVPETS